MSLQRPYIIMAALLLLVGWVCGSIITLVFPALVEQIFGEVLGMISELGERIFITEGGLTGTVTLFWHNVRAVIGMAALGLAFGIFPLLGILANGALLGVVMAMALKSGDLAVFFVGILPHGIFEIPALIIAAGTGLYLGWGRFGTGWQGLSDAVRKSVDPIILASALLVLAAFVEVNITPLLLSVVLR